MEKQSLLKEQMDESLKLLMKIAKDPELMKQFEDFKRRHPEYRESA